MEQKLVQRCETKVDADACKASYLIDIWFDKEKCYLPTPSQQGRKETFDMTWKVS